MFTNKYKNKCKCCGKSLSPGEGFCFKDNGAWSTVCNSSVCIDKLGLKPQVKSEANALTEDGRIIMGYDPKAIVLIRSLPGAKWNPDGKFWTCSIKDGDLPRVIEICDKLGLIVPESLRSRVEAGTPESREAVQRAIITNPSGKKLYPYQIEGVKFLALKDKALLADEMGTGKTAQTIVAIPSNAAVIIVCPASLKYNWSDEIKMWRGNEFSVTICNGRDSFVLPGAGQITIINYDILPDLTNQKDSLKNIILICDECHLVKNYKTKRSINVKTIADNCKKVWFLSGTPLMNRPTDLYGVLSSGNMNPFGGWQKFVSLFNGYKNQWGGYEFGIPSDEVPERMKRIMIRRLKKDVLKDLPPKSYKTINVDLDSNSYAAIDDMVFDAVKSAGLIWGDEDQYDSAELAETIINLPGFEQFSAIRAKLAESRIPAMIEVVESFEDSETPLVVFSAHRKPILELKNRDGWEIITGDTKAEERQNIVRKFQSGQLKGVGLTIAAGGVGITLTHASNVLFVDLDWTPALNIQAEDRLSRIGQVNNVLVMRMVSNHDLDKHIHNLLEYKIALAFNALDKFIDIEKNKNKNSTNEIINETEEEFNLRVQKIKDIEEQVNRQLAKEKIAKIADRERSKGKLPEPEINDERKVLLRAALEYMVSNCDGAVTKDYVGFNRPDAAIGHWIARTGLEDSDDLTFRVLERILSRYYGQLSEEFGDIWK